MNKGMTGNEFAAWRMRMKMRLNWSGAECARRLGCGFNQIAIWEKRGAPRYIALACSALTFGLPPWRTWQAVADDDSEVTAAE